MIFVGSTYSENPEMSKYKLQGGTPYGPSTVAGDGSKMPTDDDLTMAGRLAKRVAKVASGVKEVY
jgi:NAD(P)H dehydrogenase (quinone)